MASVIFTMLTTLGLPPQRVTNSSTPLPAAATLRSLNRPTSATSCPLVKMALSPSGCHQRMRTPACLSTVSSITCLNSLPGLAAARLNALKLKRKGRSIMSTTGAFLTNIAAAVVPISTAPDDTASTTCGSVNSCPLSKISIVRVLPDRRSTSSLSRDMPTPTNGCVIGDCIDALSLTSCAPASDARNSSARNEQTSRPLVISHPSRLAPTQRVLCCKQVTIDDALAPQGGGRPPRSHMSGGGNVAHKRP